MKSILVPVSSTENGINNLKYAIHFASMSGAKVYLINLYKEFSKVGQLTKVNQLLLEENEEQLKEVLSQVDTKGVDVMARPIKGNPFDGIARVSKQLNIDLIILSPQSIDIKEERYLSNTTGKILKQTEIPLLIIPRDYLFRKFQTILLAFKDGNFDKEKIFTPLKNITQLFSADLNLLQVITPDNQGSENKIDSELLEMKNKLTQTENATIFQGILEHFHSHNPDLLCVIRRNRGFFQKFKEKNIIYKHEFHTSKPLLVLSGKMQ